MNELQAEKLRDLISVINRETGIDPWVQNFTDSTVDKKITVFLRVTIPNEGNLT